MDKELYSARFLATAGVRRKNRKEKGHWTELHLMNE